MLWCVLISLWRFCGYDDGDGGGYSEGGDGCVGVDGCSDGVDGANRSLFNHLPPWAPRATAAQCRERFPKLGQQRLWRRWLQNV